jgi:hypothetical protein
MASYVITASNVTIIDFLELCADFSVTHPIYGGRDMKQTARASNG